jgi:hypothetical protein
VAVCNAFPDLADVVDNFLSSATTFNDLLGFACHPLLHCLTMFLILRMRLEAVRKVDLAQAVQATHSRHVLVRQAFVLFIGGKELFGLRIERCVFHQGFETIIGILLLKLGETLLKPVRYRRLQDVSGRT